MHFRLFRLQFKEKLISMHWQRIDVGRSLAAPLSAPPEQSSSFSSAKLNLQSAIK